MFVFFQTSKIKSQDSQDLLLFYKDTFYILVPQNSSLSPSPLGVSHSGYKLNYASHIAVNIQDRKLIVALRAQIAFMQHKTMASYVHTRLYMLGPRRQQNGDRMSLSHASKDFGLRSKVRHQPYLPISKLPSITPTSEEGISNLLSI